MYYMDWLRMKLEHLVINVILIMLKYHIHKATFMGTPPNLNICQNVFQM